MLIVGIIVVIVITVAITLYTDSKSYKDKHLDKTEEYRKNANGQIFCPHCGCTQISFDKKKKNHCMKCGFNWYPWQYEYLYEDKDQ